jgi:hypothetical protein
MAKENKSTISQFETDANFRRTGKTWLIRCR